MKSNVINILKKELREMFRDKKSLAMMLIIPFMIPLLVIGMSALFEYQTNGIKATYNRIGFAYEATSIEEEIIKEKGWLQISDEGAIKEVVQKILEANPQSIADFKAGKDRALGFLVGQAMKETKGKANPQMLNKMFIEELKK